jgi:quinol-cytochrome oxidoreductase complex cytochrome b subunit/mono/diheme cytochrome c family protein
MIRSLRDWINHRIGLSDIVEHALYERIPGGAKFRYITGSVLVFAFITQAITGIFLWMAYSPSSQTAYESVWYIQHEMTGGWLVRGVHHFMAQAMVVVMALHMLQVIWDGAYRAPREVNYWLGLVLLQLVLGLGLTGYLLPWDQKGYWATNVATNLATLVPFVGKDLQQLAVGGNEYGHHTLTRFFAMHAGVLPGLLVIFLVLHIAIFRRHGIMAKITPGRADETFWPRQVLFDGIGCLVLMGIVLLCVIHFDVAALFRTNPSVSHLGADLGAPADPAEQYSAARPEWYYLFLFQLLKYFPGKQEIIGAIVIPSVVMTLLFLLPLIGRWNLTHQFNRGFILLLLAAVGVLTALALRQDAADPEFQAAKAKAQDDAERTNELITRREMLSDGKLSEVRLIPRQGAVYLLRNDPLARGPRLFKQHCASCHSYSDPSDPEGKSGPQFLLTQRARTKSITNDGKQVTVAELVGDKPLYDPVPDANGAPNLFGFASRAWIRGLLDNERTAAPVKIGDPLPSKNPRIAADKNNPENYNRPLLSDYFGNTNHKFGRMATWVKQHAEMLKGAEGDAIAAALSAQAQLRSQAEADAKDTVLIEKGVGLIQQHCTSCHRFGEQGQLGLAPDLTGYGSYEWMMGLVSDPTSERFYRRENDRMPSFAKDLAHPENNNVSIRDLSLIVDWLRGQYYLAGDAQPVLPHTPAQADEMVRLARTVAEPRATIVGAPVATPETKLAQAERLFRQNCAACHSHVDSAGHGIATKNPTAPNLAGIGSRAWVAGILDAAKVAGPDYFGNSRHKAGQMAMEFVQTDLATPDDAAKSKIASIVVALSAEAALPAQAEADKAAESDKTLDKGRAAMSDSFGNYACTDCHVFRNKGDAGTAPSLTGWGSKDWLVRFISDPAHEDFYRDTNDRMPSFGKSGPGPKQALLTADEIDLLARWLRGEKLE